MNMYTEGEEKKPIHRRKDRETMALGNCDIK
jgi:hypothetical protein